MVRAFCLGMEIVILSNENNENNLTFLIKKPPVNGNLSILKRNRSHSIIQNDMLEKDGLYLNLILHKLYVVPRTLLF